MEEKVTTMYFHRLSNTIHYVDTAEEGRPSSDRTCSRPINLEEQMIRVHSGLRCFSSGHCSETVHICEPLRTVLDLSKERSFRQIHPQVTTSLRDIVPPERKDAVSMKTTKHLVSEMFEDTLEEMSSAFIDFDDHCEELAVDSISDSARSLLLKTMSKTQQFARLCAWLTPSGDSRVLSELEVRLPMMTSKIVGAILQTLLSISSEGSSKDTVDCSQMPVSNFLHAVADHIISGVSPELATPRQCRRESQSSVGSQSENIFMNIISSPVFILFIQDFLKEAFEVTRRILEEETSKIALLSEEGNCGRSGEGSPKTPVYAGSTAAVASRVVSALVLELRSTFQEDFGLVDYSADPCLYSARVQMVANRLLTCIQTRIRNGLAMPIFVRAHEAMKSPEDVPQRPRHLQLAVETIVLITEYAMSVSLDVASAGHFYHFLQSFQTAVILSSFGLEQTSTEEEDSADGSPPRRFPFRLPRIRLPKLRFKVLQVQNWSNMGFS
ncbi:uncharacterized protein [Hoplias malabaricus]|uniref:uncharacterized protein n=1 Tax=Hoplias malabaricus TaxID=27720 RepID=UPI0034619BEE